MTKPIATVTEAQAMEGRAALLRVMDSHDDVVVAYLPNGTIVYANDAYELLFKADWPDGCVGVNMTDIEPGKREVLLEALERNLARTPDDPQVVVETPSVDAEGQAHWYEWRCVTQFDDQDQPAMVIAIGRNRSSERISEARAQRASDRLEESNRDLLEFAQIASHDLQEPLRKVAAFSGRITGALDAGADARVLDYITRMNGAVARMQRLIEDLLSFAQVSTTGKEMRPIALQPIAEAVASDLEIALEEAGATLSIAELPTLPADATQIRQLLQNLIGNALKFSREGVAPVVTVRATHVPRPTGGNESTPASGWYDIEVSDNGIGFDEAYAHKIFAPFQRLHSRSEFDGTGVGLSVCRRIVERHQGSIVAKSPTSHGATFVIRLPASHFNGEKEFPGPDEDAVNTPELFAISETVFDQAA